MNAPKEDCQALVDALIPVAEQMLSRYGEFHPFGGGMRPNGEIVSVAGYDGRERPPSADIIRLIKDGFIQAARENQYKATALIYDVRITLPSTKEKSDAIAVSLNHRDNYSLVAIFSYKVESGELSFGDTFAQRGEADIFSSQ